MEAAFSPGLDNASVAQMLRFGIFVGAIGIIWR